MSTPENGTKLPSLREKGTTIKDLLVSNSEQIKMALPKFLPLDRLIRTALTVIATTPGLLDCSPRSLLGAVIQCAQLGLEPGVLGQAYLIPFRNNRTGKTDVQFIPGYRGLLALARRTGDISTVQAHVVRQKDRFEFRYGTDPVLEHVPSADSDSAISHIYAVIKLKDGAVQFDVMTKAEMDAHRDRYSKAAKQGPWVTAWDEMAKKTVLRRLLKLAPASIEMQTALVLDEKAEYQLPQGLDALPDGMPEDEGEPEGSTLDQLAGHLEQPAGTAA
jgi:recombination protein RecT